MNDFLLGMDRDLKKGLSGFARSLLGIISFVVVFHLLFLLMFLLSGCSNYWRCTFQNPDDMSERQLEYCKTINNVSQSVNYHVVL